jgi:nucleotide-binding universal stress UspA family protein
VAEREQCDLIVIATADPSLGRVFLGRAVEDLIRRAPTSVLVVKCRPSGPYGHILVGTDFTDEARHGLAVAASLFPGALFVVMHAFDMPYRSLWRSRQLSHDFSAMEQEEIKAFVNETDVPEQVRNRIVTLIEHGPPEIMIRNYVMEKHADLTVIGALGRGMLFHLLIGGHARKNRRRNPERHPRRARPGGEIGRTIVAIRERRRHALCRAESPCVALLPITVALYFG